MRAQRKSSHEGIDVRHSRSCGSRNGDGCDCKPTYQAHVYDKRSRRRIRKTFETVTDAKEWRRDAMTALKRRTMKPPSKLTLREAAGAWVAGAKEGTIRNRSGEPFKPSTLRGYDDALRKRVLPELGHLKLSDVSRNDMQDLADRMLAKGADPSTVRNALMPLRAIFRRAASRGDVAVNPTHGIELPAVRGRRDRIASPAEASTLLAALPEADRALWATALYAGLRRGELCALDWQHVDLQKGIIRVERGYDRKAGFVEPKSRAGKRTVPIPSVLREHLIAHKLRAGRSDGLVFVNGRGNPFDAATVARRAGRAWKAAKLTKIGLHECRHTFASLMIAAGVNAKTLSTFMGHASITVTIDRYGHLFPGSEDEAAAMLDAYLTRAAGA